MEEQKKLSASTEYLTVKKLFFSFFCSHLKEPRTSDFHFTSRAVKNPKLTPRYKFHEQLQGQV